MTVIEQSALHAVQGIPHKLTELTEAVNSLTAAVISLSPQPLESVMKRFHCVKRDLVKEGAVQ